MTSFSRIKQTYWRSIGKHLVGVNDRLAFQFFNNGVLNGLSFVYAATTVVETRSLWLSLAYDCSIFFGPHLVLGDFNAVLGAHEKMGGTLPRHIACAEFQAMVDTYNLIPVDTKGSPFTWTNGREVYCSVSNTVLISKSLVGSSRFLNNGACCLGFFFYLWLPNVYLQAKLKLLKPILKSWNLNVFGKVNAKVDAARASLEAIQLEISTGGFSEDRYAAEIQAHSCLSQALIVQEKFWSDKARVRWLRDVDRNPSYFLYELVPVWRMMFMFYALMLLSTSPLLLLMMAAQWILVYFLDLFRPW
ncbi:hypothetical protein ACFX15_023986 [Malus domestica]